MSIRPVSRVVSVPKTGLENDRAVVAGRFEQRAKALSKIATAVDGDGNSHRLRARRYWQQCGEEKDDG